MIIFVKITLAIPLQRQLLVKSKSRKTLLLASALARLLTPSAYQLLNQRSLQNITAFTAVRFRRTTARKRVLFPDYQMDNGSEIPGLAASV